VTSIRIEEVSNLFSCGHSEGTCDVMRVNDFECFHCDPEGFTLRFIFEIRRHGITQDKVSDDFLRTWLAGQKEKDRG